MKEQKHLQFVLEYYGSFTIGLLTAIMLHTLLTIHVSRLLCVKL